MTLEAFLLNFGGGALSGYTVAALGSRAGVKLSIGNPEPVHIHHDVIGLAVAGSALALAALNVISKEIGMLFFGAGMGVAFNHWMGEQPCDEGVCVAKAMWRPAPHRNEIFHPIEVIQG